MTENKYLRNNVLFNFDELANTTLLRIKAYYAGKFKHICIVHIVQIILLLKHVFFLPEPQSLEGVVATFNATDEFFLKWNSLENEVNFMYYNVRLWQPNTTNDDIVESIDKNAITADYGYKQFINCTAGTKYCVSVSTILKTPENESIESSYDPICNNTRKLG